MGDLFVCGREYYVTLIHGIVFLNAIFPPAPLNSKVFILLVDCSIMHCNRNENLVCTCVHCSSSSLIGATTTQAKDVVSTNTEHKAAYISRDLCIHEMPPHPTHI